MAKILLCAGTDAANVAGALTGLGHTVTTVTPGDSNTTLDTAWGAGHDLIFVYFTEGFSAAANWLLAKWNAGVPVLAENRGSWARAAAVGMAPTSSAISGQTEIYITDGTHPVTTGLSGTVTVYSSQQTVYCLTAPGPENLPYGTKLAEFTSFDPRAMLAAIETGDPIATGNAPARAVVAGHLRWPTSGYASANLTIIDQAVTWLSGAAPTPSASATLGISSALGATATVPHDASATLGVTSTLTANGTARVPGAAAATLAITSTLTATATVSHDGSATLGISSTLTARAAGAAGDASVTLGITSTLTADGTISAAVYASAALGISSTLAADATATAAASATMGISSTLAITMRRTFIHDATGRAAWEVAAQHRSGGITTPVDSVDFTSPVTKRLNDLDGTGTGCTFSIPRTDTAALAALPQFGEIAVKRGGHHLDAYVLIRPERQGTAEAVNYQALGLGWYLTTRRVGPAVRPQLLPKNWVAGFREGSIPAAPPKWSYVSEPVLVGPGLRVEGSTHVQVTVTRLGSDTTFARGSWVLSASGKAALRDFADEVIVDRDPDDLQDIAPPTLTIEGHTDNEPYTSHPGGNQWRSEQRAKAVYDYLVPLLPSESTVTWVGYGETRPIASNSTSEGRAANRRVDIKYPKMVSARGHRQYLADRFTYTNPSAHITRNLTLVSHWQLESYKEPNADGSVVWLGRRLAGTDDPWVADSVGIDEETPLNTPTRSEVSIEIPADGQAYEVEARLTPPAGTIVYDEGATNLMADDALEFIDVDQALIIKALVEHAQDPNFDKDNFYLTTDTPLTGIKRTKVYYWHDRQCISDCIAELASLSGGVDVTIDTTPTERTLRTHYPRAGQETGVHLTTDTAATSREFQMDDYSLLLDGASSATTTIVQADGSGADREEGVMVNPAPLGLVIEAVWTAEPASHIGELGEQAATAWARYSGHVPVITVTLDKDDTDKAVDLLDLGDRLDVTIPDPLHPLVGARAYIPGWSIDTTTDRPTYAPVLEV